MTKISIHNNTFTLQPTGTMYWEQREILFIADVHLGKVAHFRKHGSAVPQQAILKNFEQLDAAISCCNPQEVCFLGDLFHSALNTEWLYFEKWVEQQEAKITLVAGNHDIINPLQFTGIGIEIFQERILDTFLLTHIPEERDGLFNFCGHIHPGVKLQGVGRQLLKMPCFFKKPNQLILPAFGEFTGKYILEPEAHDEVFVVTPDEVILVE
ncbi:ligase-associated DNA damage response endonuclease PdeM [Dokdonia sp. Hel_I_53]|uniref:ligase-associated DNA damage response endonuclease PdeM n=1 Tax=Dokdonia sp. Hel_I_53 TaxID=1566287 RepID=UPI0011A577ED|nr:ligase-associated DNA damage response endonuclease PdeM [Dokdonia sp. Hel_I_53]